MKRVRPRAAAEPVVSTSVLNDLAAEGLEGLAQPRAALVLGRKGQQAAAGTQHPECLGQHIVPLQRPARGENYDVVRRGIGEVCKIGGAGDQGRDLQRLGRDLDEAGGWQAVEEDSHCNAPAKPHGVSSRFWPQAKDRDP